MLAGFGERRFFGFFGCTPYVLLGSINGYDVEVALNGFRCYYYLKFNRTNVQNSPQPRITSRIGGLVV
jgi:hypothetical protein